MELSGRVQELQNKVNCMNVFKDFFQDVEAVRSENSHVTSRPVSFPPHTTLEGCCDSLSYRRAAEKGRQAFGTHDISGNVFVDPFVSSSALDPQEMHQ